MAVRRVVMDRLFSMPGLGYTREEQAQQQELLRLIREYQRALQEYSRFFSDIGSESIQRLRDKFKQRSDQRGSDRFCQNTLRYLGDNL